MLLNWTVIALFIVKFYLMYHNLYLETYQKVMMVYASIYFSVLPIIAIATSIYVHEPFFYDEYDRNPIKKCMGRIVHILLTPPLQLLRMYKFVNYCVLGGDLGRGSNIAIHCLAYIPQVVILVPFLIIESIFWGRSLDQSNLHPSIP